MFEIEKNSPLYEAVQAEDSQLAVAQKLYDLGLSPDLEKMGMAVTIDGIVYRDEMKATGPRGCADCGAPSKSYHAGNCEEV